MIRKLETIPCHGELGGGLAGEISGEDGRGQASPAQPSIDRTDFN